MRAPTGIHLHPPPTLSDEQLAAYRRDGVLTGFVLFDPEHSAPIRDVLVRHVLSVPSAVPCYRPSAAKTTAGDRYLDRRLIYELCVLPQILDPVRQILGPDLVLFRSQLFDKPARCLGIPWHQESYFWRTSGDWVSLWLAIDEARLDNGALRVVLGSHRETREHRPVNADDYWLEFNHQAEPLVTDRIATFPMAAGRFMLFGDLLHSSLPNTSALPRMSFTARYARPDLRCIQEHLYNGHCCVLVSGEAGASGLRFAEPPTGGPGLGSIGMEAPVPIARYTAAT